MGGALHKRALRVLVASRPDCSHIVGVGKVIVTIKLTNFSDLVVFSRGLSKRKPRQVEVRSLVDTGAARLYLKPSVIKKLGLRLRQPRSDGHAVQPFRYARLSH